MAAVVPISIPLGNAVLGAVPESMISTNSRQTLSSLTPIRDVPMRKKTYIVSLADGQWSIPITLGSQSVPYNVTADTGSGIVDFTCSCCMKSKASSDKLYNPLNSSTYKIPTPSACSRFLGGNASCDWCVRLRQDGLACNRARLKYNHIRTH